jgi:DNA repair protein RadC
MALLLDGKNRVVREVQVSEGSLNQSIVHPREVFNPAVRNSAAAIILVHNHPTGDPAPSREDMELTRRLKEAGDLMGIRLLDHIIIGDGSYVSLADKGMM